MAKRDHTAAPDPEYPGFCGTCGSSIIRAVKPGMADKRHAQAGKYGNPFPRKYEDYTWRHRPERYRYLLSRY